MTRVMSRSTAEDTNDHSTYQQALEQTPEYFPTHFPWKEALTNPMAWKEKKIFCFM